MNRFSCSFAGQCEDNIHGEYASEEECRADCQGIPNKDIRYSIYEFAPAEARYLAPSDQAYVVKRLTGISLSPEEAVNTLDMLNRQAWNELASDDRFLPYIRRNYQGKLTFELILEGEILQNFLSLLPGHHVFLEREMMRILALAEFPTEHLRNGDIIDFIYVDVNSGVPARAMSIWDNGQLLAFV